jgi:hypothetical protein
MAPIPDIIASPTAKTCDREDTDPMTNSGEGIAFASRGTTTRRAVLNRAARSERVRRGEAGVGQSIFTKVPVAEDGFL